MFVATCCTCKETCCHTGPHTYCSQHGGPKATPPPFPVYKFHFVDRNAPRTFKCAKCSCDIVRVEFKAALSFTEEYLACTCTRCDYRWNEKPSDYKVIINIPQQTLEKQWATKRFEKKS